MIVKETTKLALILCAIFALAIYTDKGNPFQLVICLWAYYQFKFSSMDGEQVALLVFILFGLMYFGSIQSQERANSTKNHLMSECKNYRNGYDNFCGVIYDSLYSADTLDEYY